MPHSTPYLRLGPHERESHAAFEEVRFQQFTGNAHFLLEERKTPTDGPAAQDRCGHGLGETDGDFGRHSPSLVPRKQPLLVWGDEEPLTSTSPRPPLVPILLLIRWEDRCRGQNHSSFFTNVCSPGTRDGAPWTPPTVWMKRQLHCLSGPFLLSPHPNPTFQDLANVGKSNSKKITPTKIQGFFLQPREMRRAELLPCKPARAGSRARTG